LALGLFFLCRKSAQCDEYLIWGITDTAPFTKMHWIGGIRMLRKLRLAPGVVAKQLWVPLALVMLLPVAALANSETTCLNGVTGAVCIYNTGGTAMGSNSGLIMNGTGGSTVSTINTIGNFGSTGSNLGTLAFTTGSLLSGSLSAGGTFNDGTFTITTNGNFPGYPNGLLFTGTFGNSAGGAPITWTYTGKVGKYYDYTLSGPVSGTWEGGPSVSGVTAQLFFHSTTKYTGGAISLASGTTTIITPEPAPLGLLGTGMVAIGFLANRKVRQSRGV
jgi:hypothetical protein